MILQIDSGLIEEEYPKYSDDMVALAQEQQKIIDEALLALAKQKVAS